MKRSIFLQQSSALVAGSLLTGIVPALAQNQLAQSKKKRIAMVGTGGRAISMWGIPVIAEFSNLIEFVGLCDINPGRVETAKKKMKLSCPTYTDFDKMMQETKPDELIVTSIDSTHHHFIIKGMEYGADIIVFGEGEDTMLELVKAWNMKKDPELQNMPGIAFKTDNEVTVTPDRVLIRDIDQLPFPHRKKIDLKLYFDVWKQKHGISMVNVNTMRGCPYSCKWCSRAVYGSSYRRRSPKLVVDEIQWLQENYQFDMIWFVDDVFTISHKWLHEFAEEISHRKITVSYEIITRSDRVNDEVVLLLKQSGCFRVWIGAESGSQKIIDAMDRRVKVEQVRETIKLVKTHGMEAGTFIMLGYPGEDENDIRETLHHLKYSDPDHFTITVAYPIKGTPLYSEVENIFTEELPWESSTDRDIDFKRRYKRSYYTQAIKWINNEMLYTQKKKNLRSLLIKLKALKARSMMWVIKMA